MSGWHVRARTGAEGLPPLSLICSLLLQPSRALTALFLALIWHPSLAFVICSRGLAASVTVKLLLESRRGVGVRVVFLKSDFREFAAINHWGGVARQRLDVRTLRVFVFSLLLIFAKVALVCLSRRRAMRCGMQEGWYSSLSGSLVSFRLLDCGLLWPLDDILVRLHPSDTPILSLFLVRSVMAAAFSRRFGLLDFSLSFSVATSECGCESQSVITRFSRTTNGFAFLV
ncbi:hypothetical protein Bca4012_058867 [Brassica carinata]